MPSAFSLGVADNTHSPNDTHRFGSGSHLMNPLKKSEDDCELTQMSHQLLGGHYFSLSRKFSLKTHKYTTTPKYWQ